MGLVKGSKDYVSVLKARAKEHLKKDDIPKTKKVSKYEAAKNLVKKKAAAIVGFAKSLPGKAKDYLNHEKEEVRLAFRKYTLLKAKINSGKASLKDKMDYRMYKAKLISIPIKATVAVAVPGGTVAVMGAAALDKKLNKNRRTNLGLINKSKAGGKLSFAERYRLRSAAKLGSKSQRPSKK